MSIKKAKQVKKDEKQAEKTVKAVEKATEKAVEEVKQEVKKAKNSEAAAVKKEEKKIEKAAEVKVKTEEKTQKKEAAKKEEAPVVLAPEKQKKTVEKVAKKAQKKLEKTDKEEVKLEEKAVERAEKENEKLEEKLAKKQLKEEEAEKIVPEENKEQAESQQKDIEVEVVRKRSLLFVASECNPFVGTGGLADVIGSLPLAISERGNYDVRVILPLYGTMDEGYRNHLTYIGNFNVPVGWRNQYCGLFSYKRKGVTYLFIDNEYYFRRPTLYGHYDDGERFAFFSRAVLEAMQYMNWYPDVMHCHDWQTALAVIYLKTIYANRWGFDHIRAIFTIHNIEYQGKYGKEILEDLFGLPYDVEPALDYDGCLNLMKGAIQLSDYVTTVSKT